MSQGNSVLGVLFGAAIGAGLGILFAPDKGSNTRKKLVENANDAKDQFLEEAEKIKANVSKETEQIRNNVAETLSTKKQSLDGRLDTIVSDASYKADELITSLERRLKTLKAKNKKYQNTKTTVVDTK